MKKKIEIHLLVGAVVSHLDNLEQEVVLKIWDKYCVYEMRTVWVKMNFYCSGEFYRNRKYKTEKRVSARRFPLFVQLSNIIFSQKV
ncbi:MAG: hypothetical protein HY960_04685 [Ignavibacteriae bacterium]|nr:hypothetical protein [Ignavibacteriota bacterium]